MSDEFVKLATLEINQEISEISSILNTCSGDDDVKRKASELQKHTHKIKGLAPMMGKKNLGSLSSELDFIFKKIIDGESVAIFDELHDCLIAMKNDMDSGYDYDKINPRIRGITSKIQK